MDATIRALSISALPIGRSASTSDHTTFNKGRPVHARWKKVDATSNINDISNTNKPAALSRNQTPTQRRQTNLLPSPGPEPLPQGRQTNLLPPPGTKPLPKVVKQTCCPLQEPNPYPRSSNKPAALSRNQTPTQGRQTNLLPSSGTKLLPNVVKQSRCPLQESTPYPRS